jgi:hypothetical protein
MEAMGFVYDGKDIIQADHGTYRYQVLCVKAFPEGTYALQVLNQAR